MGLGTLSGTMSQAEDLRWPRPVVAGTGQVIDVRAGLTDKGGWMINGNRHLDPVSGRQ